MPSARNRTPRVRTRMALVAAVEDFERGAAWGAGAAPAFVWHGHADAVVETEAERVRRLADANRIAEVARKIAAEAKRVEEAAQEKKENELAKVADAVKKNVEQMTRQPPPPREEALRKL